MIEKWWNPNHDAGLDPVEFREHWDLHAAVVITRADLVRVLEAAGFVPDDRADAEFDEAAWAEDFGGAA